MTYRMFLSKLRQAPFKWKVEDGHHIVTEGTKGWGDYGYGYSPIVVVNWFVRGERLINLHERVAGQRLGLDEEIIHQIQVAATFADEKNKIRQDLLKATVFNKKHRKKMPKEIRVKFREWGGDC